MLSYAKFETCKFLNEQVCVATPCKARADAAITHRNDLAVEHWCIFSGFIGSYSRANYLLALHCGRMSVVGTHVGVDFGLQLGHGFSTSHQVGDLLTGLFTSAEVSCLGAPN